MASACVSIVLTTNFRGKLIYMAKIGEASEKEIAEIEFSIKPEQEKIAKIACDILNNNQAELDTILSHSRKGRKAHVQNDWRNILAKAESRAARKDARR